MERDLSLIHISGEDDSLLHKIPIDDISTSYFSCSPLQLSRSANHHLPNRSLLSSPLAECKNINNDAETPYSLLHCIIANKENANHNKQEVLKLGVDPQQMKKKKRGAVHNLRKSLAWDKAFFTEEGVLDASELSLISGNHNRIGGETLSTIHEEAREPLSDEIEVASVLAKGRKDGGTLFQKNGSPFRSQAGQCSTVEPKAISSHGTIITGSKRSGCPQPINSASLKRPSTMNTRKAKTEELKASKMAVANQDPCRPSRIARNTTNLQKNHISRTAVVGSQKNTGSKLSIKNTKSAPSETRNSCKSSSPKPKFQQARNFLVKSVSKTHSSMNAQHKELVKENPGSRDLQHAVQPPASHASSGCLNSTIKVGVSLPQRYSSSYGKEQCAQSQTQRPTGLRMPSPSLGFFGQSKATGLHSLLQKSTACNIQKSNIPNMPKGSAAYPVNKRPPNVLTVANDVTTGTTSPNCSNEKRLAPTVTPILQEKTNLKTGNIQSTMEVKLDNQNGYVMVPGKSCLQSIVSHEGKWGGTEDKESHLLQGVDKQLKKDCCNEGVVVDCEDFSGEHYAKKQAKPLELPKSDIYKFHLIPSDKDQNQHIKDDTSAKFEKYNGENRGDDLQMFHLQPNPEVRRPIKENSCPVEDNVSSAISSSVVQDKQYDLTRECEQLKPLIFSYEKSQEENILLQEKEFACASDLNNSPALCLIPPSAAVPDCASGANLLLECEYKDVPTDFAISKAELKICNYAIIQSGDIKLHDRDISLDLDRIDKFERLDTTNACKAEATNLSPGNIDIGGCDLDTNHIDQSTFMLSAAEHSIKLPLEQVKRVKNVINKPCLKISCFRGSSSSHESCKSDPSTPNSFLIVNNFRKERTDHRLSDPNPHTEAIQISPAATRLHSDDNFFSVEKSFSHEQHESNIVSKPLKVLYSAIDANVNIENPPEDAIMVSKEAVDPSTRCEDDLNDGSIFLKFDQFSEIPKCEILDEMRFSPKPLCLNEGSVSLEVANDNTEPSKSIPQNVAGKLSETNNSRQETKSNVSAISCYEECQVQLEMDNALCSGEDADVALLKECEGQNKVGAQLVKPPSDAVPFSDEWLAAFEAAGEDILTMKSGAVQNSPPEKPLPEHGPWSPVKRKNQELGPFDCTKYTNASHTGGD